MSQPDFRGESSIPDLMRGNKVLAMGCYFPSINLRGANSIGKIEFRVR